MLDVKYYKEYSFTNYNLPFPIRQIAKDIMVVEAIAEVIIKGHAESYYCLTNNQQYALMIDAESYIYRAKRLIKHVAHPIHKTIVLMMIDDAVCLIESAKKHLSQDMDF